MDVRKGEIIKENGMPIGNRMKVKIVKNKVAPPFRECEYDNIYGKGISRTGEIMDLAVELDVIQKSGSWFSYDGKKLGQGRDNVKQMLADDESFRKEVEAKILAHMNEIDLTSGLSEEEDAKELASIGNYNPDNFRVEYVAFSANQIKHIDNTGTYSKENPNIYDDYETITELNNYDSSIDALVIDQIIAAKKDNPNADILQVAQ
jgi:hypothetical protein